MLHDVPRILDVETMLVAPRRPSARASSGSAPNSLRIDAARLRAGELDPELCERIRGSLLLAGPLVARYGEVTMPPPGGDVIGRRRVDTHVIALECARRAVTVGRGATA